MSVVTFPSDPLLPLVPCDSNGRGPRAWPKYQVGRRVSYHRLSWLLTAHHTEDVFTSAYSVPAIERRLAGEAPKALANRGGVPMVVYLFDYDCTAAHLATGGSGKVFADDVWWALTVQRVAPLLRAHPGGYVYRTRGGARIVYQRPEPLVLRGPVEELQWKREYCGLLAYLARRFGIVCDPTTHDWPRLMRLPHTKREGVVLDLPAIGDPRRILPLEYAPTDPDRERDLDAVRALGERDPRWRSLGRLLAGNTSARAERALRPRAVVEPREIDAGVLSQLAVDLGVAMRGIVGTHFVHLALAGACYERGVPLVDGPRLGAAISAAKGGSDRSQTWETTAARVASGLSVRGWDTLQARYPHIAAILDAALPREGGARTLRDELDARGVPEAIPAGDAAETLRAAIDRRDVGPSLVRVTEGAGKTRAAIEVLKTRASAIPEKAKAVPSARKVLYVAPTHAVAEEVAGALAGLRAEYWRSPLAVKDAAGRPLCAKYAQVQPLVQAGHALTAWCKSPCPSYEGCPARAESVLPLGPDAPPAVVVTVHALLEQGAAWAGEDALVIVDEDPEALTAVEITRPELEAAAAAVDLFAPSEAFRGPVVRALAAGLERGELLDGGEAFHEVLARGCAALQGDEGWEGAALAHCGTTDPGELARVFGLRSGWRQRKTPQGTTWEKRAGWAPWPTRSERERAFVGHADQRLAPASKTLAMIGRLACGIVREAPEGKASRERGASRVEVCHRDPSRRVLRGVMASPAVGEALGRYGSTVLLDATADPEVLGALVGGKVPTTTLRVADGAPITREVIYWSAATRRAVFAGDLVRWDHGLARYLAEALGRAVAFTPKPSVALFGWEALIRRFREGNDPTAAELVAIVTRAGGTITFGHYGAARSRNDWKGCDALVSVGDPLQNLGASRAIAAVLGLSHDHQRIYRHLAAAELSQVSGRLRAPWRTKPALHVHVGTVVPLAWDARAAVLELPRGRVDQLVPDEAARAVHVYGSQRLAGASLGAGHRSVKRAMAKGRDSTESPCLSHSHTMGHVTPSEIELLEASGPSCDSARSHTFSGMTPETAAIPAGSMETPQVTAPPTFDDAAQFALIARAGGPKAVAALLGVHRATAYSWATAKGTRRMPPEARERLEALLDALPTLEEELA